MAFTASDRTAVEQAMVRLATDGIASVTVAGETVVAKTMEDLERLLKLINSDLAAASDRPGLGIRIQQWKPYYP